MRPRIHWNTLCGSLAILAWACLASPGVRVVRADAAEGPQSREPAAASCEAGTTARDVAAFQAYMAEVERQAAAERAAGVGDAGDRVIPLNNRGYNYGQPPGVDLTKIMREVAIR